MPFQRDYIFLNFNFPPSEKGQLSRVGRFRVKTENCLEKNEMFFNVNFLKII
jgi:hypothetical protein